MESAGHKVLSFRRRDELGWDPFVWTSISKFFGGT